MHVYARVFFFFLVNRQKTWNEIGMVIDPPLVVYGCMWNACSSRGEAIENTDSYQNHPFFRVIKCEIYLQMEV